MCGICKDLPGRRIMPSLFLRIRSHCFTRIPLPPSSGAPSPQERIFRSPVHEKTAQLKSCAVDIYRR